VTDVFANQVAICQAIVDKQRIALAAGCPLVKRYTENVEAYNLYLKVPGLDDFAWRLHRFGKGQKAKSTRPGTGLPPGDRMRRIWVTQQLAP
jgi:hypothetical protein